MSKIDNNQNRESNNNYLLLVKLFAGIIFLWLVFWVLIDISIAENNRGIFGDKFGAITSLFSGLTLAGLIYTIRLQIETINLQRDSMLIQQDELKLQREELEKTRQEFNIQNETLGKQRFENTFFQMVSLYNEIINNLSPSFWNGVTYIEASKREAFSSLTHYLKNQIVFKEMGRNDSGETILKHVDQLELSKEEIEVMLTEGYNSFLERYGPSIKHYYRTIYQIYNFIDNFSPPDHKELYSEIMRSQFSSNELLLLFYYSLDRPNYLYLFKTYFVLKNVEDSILFSKTHKVIYKERLEKIRNYVPNKIEKYNY